MINSLLIFLVILIFLIYLASVIVFTKAKDIYSMTQIVIIIDCFIFPISILILEFQKFSWVSLLKVLLIMIINLIITLLITYVICRRSLINNIMPDAIEKN